jgi:hypothetical protein
MLKLLPEDHTPSSDHQGFDFDPLQSSLIRKERKPKTSCTYNSLPSAAESTVNASLWYRKNKDQGRGNNVRVDRNAVLGVLQQILQG